MGWYRVHPTVHSRVQLYYNLLLREWWLAESVSRALDRVLNITQTCVSIPKVLRERHHTHNQPHSVCQYIDQTQITIEKCDRGWLVRRLLEPVFPIFIVTFEGQVQVKATPVLNVSKQQNIYITQSRGKTHSSSCNAHGRPEKELICRSKVISTLWYSQ